MKIRPTGLSLVPLEQLHQQAARRPARAVGAEPVAELSGPADLFEAETAARLFIDVNNPPPALASNPALLVRVRALASNPFLNLDSNPTQLTAPEWNQALVYLQTFDAGTQRAIVSLRELFGGTAPREANLPLESLPGRLTRQPAATEALLALVSNPTYNRQPASGTLSRSAVSAALAHPADFTATANAGLGLLQHHFDFTFSKALSPSALAEYFGEMVIGVAEIKASQELKTALSRAGVPGATLISGDAGGDGLLSGDDWSRVFNGLAGGRGRVELIGANGQATALGEVVKALANLGEKPSAIPGLPARLAAVRQQLIDAGQPFFNEPYPADEAIPAAVKAMKLRLPFARGARVVCAQSNNSMFNPATHAPASLRYALDFQAPDESAGLPVAAAAGGTAYVYGGGRPDKGDNYGLGNLIIIDHHNGYATLYAHLGDSDVQTGQTIAAGQRIGAMGNSGLAGSFHLHYQLVELLRTPDPATESYQAEMGEPPPKAPPFGATVRHRLQAQDVTAGGAVARIDTTAFRSGESGLMPTNAHTYSAP